MKTLLYIIGVIVLINTVLIIALLTDKPGTPSFAGVTHLGGLELAETLSVTGESTFNGNLISNGGFITKGGLALGVVASSAITAAQICDYDYITIDPTYDDDGDFYGASISLPTEATMIADCFSATKTCKTTRIENIASVSARIDIYLGDTNAYALHATSSTSEDLDYDMFVELKACSVAGTDTASISWDYNQRAK